MRFLRSSSRTVVSSTSLTRSGSVPLAVDILLLHEFGGLARHPADLLAFEGCLNGPSVPSVSSVRASGPRRADLLGEDADELGEPLPLAAETQSRMSRSSPIPSSARSLRRKVIFRSAWMLPLR